MAKIPPVFNGFLLYSRPKSTKFCVPVWPHFLRLFLWIPGLLCAPQTCQTPSSYKTFALASSSARNTAFEFQKYPLHSELYQKKCLLRISYVPHTVLGPGNTAQTDKSFCYYRVYALAVLSFRRSFLITDLNVNAIHFFVFLFICLFPAVCYFFEMRDLV